MWASDILEALDREKVYEGADFCFHDVDTKFSKQAKMGVAVEEANEFGKKIWVWNPGWPTTRRNGKKIWVWNPGWPTTRRNGNKQYVVFVAADEDELRGRLAVMEVMAS